MSARYRQEDFKNAGTQPCVRCVSITATNDYPKLWMACDYHEGYIDGYEAAKEQR